MSKGTHKPVLTERDRSMLRDMIESRVVTLSQLTALHFGGKREYAKKRLQRLKAVGYVAERKPRQNPGRFFSSMLSIGKAGFEAIADDPFVREEGMSWQDISSRLDYADNTLAHELEVVDMKVAFMQAVRTAGAPILEEFSTFPGRYEFTTEHLERGTTFLLRPDGYARISWPAFGEHTLFFEWDRSTEAHRRLGQKAYGYDRYFASGAFALWNRASPEERDRHRFTPVFILPNDERRNNTAEHLVALRHPKTGARMHRDAFLLTTHAEFLADPLGPIYITPSAYQEATRGTPYDPANHKATVRVRDRDRLVATRIKKTELIGSAS